MSAPARLRPHRWTTRRASSPSAARARLPPGRRGRRDRRQPRQPGRYWYANLIMGAHVLEQPRSHGRAQARRRWARSAPTRSLTPVPFREDELWNGYPRRRTRPTASRRRRSSSARRPTASSTGSTPSSSFPPISTGRGDNFDLESSHVIPALIRKMVESPERGRALGRWLADARVPLRRRLRRRDRARGRALRRRRARQPRHRRRDRRSATSAELVAELTGFEGEIVWDTSRPNGQPRRRLDASKARAALRLPRAHAAARGPRADDRVVPARLAPRRWQRR